MTWSIVARDPHSGALGVAVTTGAFACGSRCPWVRAGVGAVSTQSVTNHFLGPAILDRLAAGLDPAEAVRDALAGDAGHGIRQVHCVDRHGNTAAYTGENCISWCGHRHGTDTSVAGNMLAGAAVLTATLGAFGESDLPLAGRLLAGLAAGHEVGGDRRGVRSAALMVATDNIIPDVDLRVDEHVDPLSELSRLLSIWHGEIEPRLPGLPTRQNPAGLIDLDALEEGWKAKGLDFQFARRGA